MTSMYFPFRTNVHYWDVDPFDADLEGRIKLGALLYDELIFDEGGYQAFIGPKLRFEIRLPRLEQASDDFFDRHFPPEGGEFAVAFGGVSLESVAQRRYQVCFRRILTEAGIVDMPWITFTDLGLTKEAEDESRQLSEQDLNALHDGDIDTFILTSHILKSVNYDWMMGTLNRWDLNMDPIHETYLRQKLSLVAKEVDFLNPPVDFEILFPRLPDLSRVSWDQVLEAREHPSVVELRKRLGVLSKKTRQAYLAGESADAIHYYVETWINDQLLEEFGNRLMTPGQAIQKVAINLAFVIGGVFLPLVGIADSVRGVVELLADYTKDRESLAATFIRKHRDDAMINM